MFFTVVDSNRGDPIEEERNISKRPPLTMKTMHADQAEEILADRRTVEGMQEFFRKWKELPITEASWEPAETVKQRWPQLVNAFRDRESTRT